MGTYIQVGSEVLHVVGPYGRGDGTSPDSPLPGEVVERMIAGARVRERERRQLEFMRGPLGTPAELGDPREVVPDAVVQERLHQEVDRPRVEPVDEAVAVVAQAFGGEPVSGEDVAREREKLRAFEPIDEGQLPIARRAYEAGRAARTRVDSSTIRELVREAMDSMASTNKATATWPFADRVADYVAERFAELGRVVVDQIAGKFVDRRPRKTWDAIRWTGQNWDDVSAWLGPRVDTMKLDPEDPTRVVAWDEDGRLRCASGSWFAQGEDGFVRVFDDEKFRKLYEPAPLDEEGFAVASALGMTDNVGEPRPRLLDDRERADLVEALTFKSSASAGQHQMPAGRYSQLRAAIDRVSSSTWVDFPLSSMPAEQWADAPPTASLASVAGELARWRRWAGALLKYDAMSEWNDETQRKKIAAVLEAPAVLDVDEVDSDLVASAPTRHKQLPPTTKLNPFVVEACARVANAVYREALNSGDPMPAWDDASEDERASERETVVAALTGVSPATYHARWRTEREAEGWRYGPVKDEEAKVHPNLVNYMLLPAGQRMLDSLFVAAVKATRRALAEYESVMAAPLVARGITTAEAAAKGWVNDPFKILDDAGAEMGRLTPDRMRELFAEHCECRPVNTARESHSHDCDTDVTDDVRTLLHHVVMPGPEEMSTGELRPSTAQEEIVARNRLAIHIAARAAKQ